MSGFPSSIVIATVAMLGLLGCAKMQRDWEAQQQAQAQQQANAQPANMEQLCKGVQQAYCARCNVAGDPCSQIYVTCLGTSSPADASRFNQGEVQQCAADVGAGDCAVMPRVWPATCSAPTPITCTGGAVSDGTQCMCQGGSTWDGTQCVCAAGTTWDGTQCAAAGITCTGGAVSDGTQCVCQGGSTWDGTQCMCAAGTQWDGAQCAAVSAPAPRGGGRCRAALLKKNYAPEVLPNCDGVNDRCAVALINKGYGPDQLANCRGVDGACAEQLIAKGYGVDQLANCRR